MRMEETNSRFSQRHPFTFGVLMIIMAVALILGAMAFSRSLGITSAGTMFDDDKLGEIGRAHV